MPDNRITIRLTPREIRALRAIVEAFDTHPNIAAHLGIGREQCIMAADLLTRLPVFVPQAATDNHQPATNNL